MNQHAAPLLSEDQLQEPPTVHIATGMIAAELDLSCADAFDLLHERALDDGSLSVAAQRVVRREISASDGDGLRTDPRLLAARRARWSIRGAGDRESFSASCTDLPESNR